MTLVAMRHNIKRLHHSMQILVDFENEVRVLNCEIPYSFEENW